MNDKQKSVAILTGAVLFLMLLFPPFHRQLSSGNYLGQGYGFILSPPNMSTIDVLSLMVQWLFVVSIGFIAFWLFKSKP